MIKTDSRDKNEQTLVIVPQKLKGIDEGEAADPDTRIFNLLEGLVLPLHYPLQGVHGIYYLFDSISYW